MHGLEAGHLLVHEPNFVSQFREQSSLVIFGLKHFSLPHRKVLDNGGIVRFLSISSELGEDEISNQANLLLM